MSYYNKFIELNTPIDKDEDEMWERLERQANCYGDYDEKEDEEVEAISEEMLNEVHKMAQIALGKQITLDCTKWAIKEGFFDNFVSLYKAGYRQLSNKN